MYHITSITIPNDQWAIHLRASYTEKAGQYRHHILTNYLPTGRSFSTTTAAQFQDMTRRRKSASKRYVRYQATPPEDHPLNPLQTGGTIYFNIRDTVGEWHSHLLSLPNNDCALFMYDVNNRGSLNALLLRHGTFPFHPSLPVCSNPAYPFSFLAHITTSHSEIPARPHKRHMPCWLQSRGRMDPPPASDAATRRRYCDAVRCGFFSCERQVEKRSDGAFGVSCEESA